MSQTKAELINAKGGADLGALNIDGSAPDNSVNLDASGRLLVGTSSWSGNNSKLVCAGNTGSASGLGLITAARGDVSANLSLNSEIGRYVFADLNGAEFARIACFVDATPGATNDYPGRLVFSTTADGASSPTERMRITEDGRVLVGTTDTEPIGNNTQGIALRGDAGSIQVSRNGLAASFNRFTTNGEVVRFLRNGVDVGSIDVTTTATSYNTSSDYRLKENVVDLDGAINRLKQLPVHRFNFIADPDTTVDGFIAHEAAEVVPEAVTGTKDEVDEDGNPVHQGIDQSKLVPLLTAALQEAVAKIESLEARLTAAGI